MSARVPLFVELCAGSAAVTLRLIGGPNARPPISYMGSKRGYASAILSVLGLRSGQGADACVLVEAGPWAKAWRLLTTPEGCRAVADVIRGWVGEDARALWDRLRAEPVPEDAAAAVGAWCCLQGGVYMGYPIQEDGAGSEKSLDPQRAPGRGLWPQHIPPALGVLSALSWPPVQVIDGDVVGVEPRDVAKWLWTQPRTRPARPQNKEYFQPASSSSPLHHGGDNYQPDTPAPRVDALAGLTWPPTIVSNADVSTVEPGTLPEGTVCYMDPPYANTTGYQAKLPREKVLEVAQRWADAGATVCVSEAEPLPLPGWHHVEITECRVGQKRTFSKQKREWLTLNRAPAWVPGVQGGLL